MMGESSPLSPFVLVQAQFLFDLAIHLLGAISFLELIHQLRLTASLIKPMA
jgi:hypothetical protein